MGAELARVLKRPFVDLDQVLVAEAGQSVAEIVASGGWEEFRRLEKELVGRYRQTRGQVLATGGGVVLDPENVGASAAKTASSSGSPPTPIPSRPGWTRTGPGTPSAPASPAATP